MSYPGGGFGYGSPGAAPQPPQQPQQTGPAPASKKSKSLLGMAMPAVAVLGVVNFLLGFMSFAGLNTAGVTGMANSATSVNFFNAADVGASAPLALLLLAGLLAAISLLPKQDWRGAAAAAAVAGFLALLFQSFALPDGVDLKSGAYVVLVLGFIEAVTALATVLMESGLLAAWTAGSKRVAGVPGGYGRPGPGYPPAGYPGSPGYPSAGYQQPGPPPGQPPQQPYGAPGQPYGQPGWNVPSPQGYGRPPAEANYPTTQFAPQAPQQPAPDEQGPQQPPTPTESFPPQQPPSEE